MIFTTVDKVGYKNKPQGREIGLISKRIANEKYQINNLYEFADLIANKGCTWCPAIFDKKEILKILSVLKL